MRRLVAQDERIVPDEDVNPSLEKFGITGEITLSAGEQISAALTGKLVPIDAAHGLVAGQSLRIGPRPLKPDWELLARRPGMDCAWRSCPRRARRYWRGARADHPRLKLRAMAIKLWVAICLMQPMRGAKGWL